MATIAQRPSMPSDKAPLGKRIAIGVAVVAALALLFWGVSRIKLSSGGAPKRQTVKIMLPDTPPPPPPKQEEKKPEPKQENKPTQQMEQKQVQAPPQPAQALKMDGAAGNGPSAFQAGNVSKDYQNGLATTGPGGGTSADRAKYQFYITSMKQQLKDAIERNLQTEEKRVTVTFSLWIDSEGHIKKYELAPIGNERAQAEVEAAFDKASRDARLPPPAADMVQPLRLRMTLLPPAS